MGAEMEIRDMVTRHDEAISHVTTSIDRLATAVEKTDDKMDKVIEALSQNAVILEKIANIDSSNKDSVNRLHKRIDETLLLIAPISAKADRGSKVYDYIAYTGKVLTWAVPILSAFLVGLLWVIDHNK